MVAKNSVRVRVGSRYVCFSAGLIGVNNDRQDSLYDRQNFRQDDHDDRRCVLSYFELKSIM